MTVALIAPQHRVTVDYANKPVATSVEELSAETSRYQDTAILDFTQHVQTTTLTAALAGTLHAELPVLSLAAPFSRTAVFPRSGVHPRHHGALHL